MVPLQIPMMSRLLLWLPPCQLETSMTPHRVYSVATCSSQGQDDIRPRLDSVPSFNRPLPPLTQEKTRMLVQVQGHLLLQ
jgi:hypothetical protein